MDFNSNLNNYLTEEERQQMEELLQKAAGRKGKNEKNTEQSGSLLFWQIQYERKRKKLDEEYEKKKLVFGTELQRLMEQACSFCQKNGYCEDSRKCRLYDEDDEELPLDILENNDEPDDEKAEWQKQYQAGKMSMLFSLVDRGKLTLDEAAECVGMTWGEAEDMLQGWQEAQKM